ncbi:MAG: alpha-amylase family glycosyl hydrolase, partial [Treponema sp.]|nr:alpha-amylase family glycosyl hydrolase [Treponema sp.]
MIRKWYENAIVYHIYTLSLGRAPFLNDYSLLEHKFAEIEKWIPHIKGMGFNGILFSPLLKSRSHGYDVTDYFEIDNRLGTNDEFRSLVKTFHENGIRVILDSVFNHCGRDFFAFRALRQNDRSYANWFSGVDFGKQNPLGDPFSYDTWNGFYELPKFNLQNSDTRNYLLDAARFWIDTFDIDGMRLDAANVLDFGFMSGLRRVTEERKPDFWLMGEVVAGDYTRWVNASTLHSVTNYILYKSLFSSHNDNNLHELAYCLQNSVPDNGLPLYMFLDNHDQNRIASNVSNPAYLNTLYALLFTLPGVPSVYYGSEWGIRGVKKSNSDQDLRPYIDIDKRSSYSTALTG